jgi:RNA polymerase sigma-70 factor (ECF subfamily)
MDLDPVTLSRAQQGQRAAQAVVLRRYAPTLRSLVRRFIPPSRGGQADVEDALQELMIKVLQALPQYRAERTASLGTWVFTVAHRWLLERSRGQRLEVVASTEGKAQAEAVADHRPGADDGVAAKDIRQALEQALATLSLPLRRTFVLARVHGLALEVIADQEGVPLGTVKSRLHHARAQLVVALRGQLDALGVTHGNVAIRHS